MKRKGIHLHLVILAIVLAAVVTMKLPLVTNAASDRNLVRTFDTDEYSSIVTVEKAVHQKFKTDFYYYGNLYPLITASVLLPLKYLGVLNDEIMIATMRGFSLFFFVAAVLLLYIFGSRFFSRFVGLAAALLLVFTTEVNYHATISKADTLQIFLVIACFYFVCLFLETASPAAMPTRTAAGDVTKDRSALYLHPRVLLTIAGAFAGLAFSTKYIGVFILPTLLFASAMRVDFQLARWKTILGDVVGFFVAFCLAFAVTSPYHIIYNSQFKSAMRTANFWVTKAFVHELSPNPFLWFEVVQKTDLFGPILFYVLACCTAYYAVSLYNQAIRARLTEPRDRRVLTLIFWVLSFSAYLFVRIRLREVRYLLPLIPFLYVIFAVAIEDVWTFIKRNTRRKSTTLCQGLVVLVVAAVSLSMKGNLNRAVYLHKDLLSRPHSNSIKAGKWLATNVSSDQAVYFDYYSYIPASFKRIRGSYGMFDAQKKEINPDLIVVNSSIYTRYDSVEKAEKYEEGSVRGMEIYNFYRNLFSGQTEFKLIADFDEVKIFQKQY
jgi:hypothetical protein